MWVFVNLPKMLSQVRLLLLFAYMSGVIGGDRWVWEKLQEPHFTQTQL